MSNRILKKVLFSVLSLMVAVCFADDPAPANTPGQWQDFGGNRGNRGGNRGDWGNRGGNRGNRGGNRGNRGNWGNRGGNRGNMMEIMSLFSSVPRIMAFESIRSKFPKESAELNKIILETEQKYAELAKKAEVELPASLESNMIKLHAADPAGYEEAIKAVKASPHTGLTKLNELAKKHKIQLVPPRRRIEMREGRNVEAPNTNRNIQRPDFRKLRSKFPKEMEQYEAARREDPVKARQMLADMIKRMNENPEKK